ncbi:MAG: hypothetical protein AAF549_03045 [Pseudomonadota bacterium]
MKLSNYEDWKHCITKLCNIPLAPEYIEKRIEELNNLENIHTKKFVDMWGEDHLKNVTDWFEQARQEFKS